MWSQLSRSADPGHVGAVLHALRGATPRCGPTAVVALDGPSGSGKTTLAAALADALDAPVVHLDAVYPGWDGLAAAVPIVVDEVLTPLSRGLTARYRTWDWAADAWNGRLEVAPTPVLVLEGCGAATGAAGDLAAVRVWLEAPVDVRRRRGLERDGDTFAPHWDRWAAQESALFAADRTRERADVVLSTGEAT